MRLRAFLFCALALIAGLGGSPGAALAQTGTPAQALTACGSPSNSPVNGGYYSLTTDLNLRLCGSQMTAVSSVTGSVTGVNVGTTSAQVLAAAPRQLLALDNESTTATVACAFGAVAAINTKGSFTLPPGVTRTWNSYPVPADAVNCIASALATPLTIEAN